MQKPRIRGAALLSTSYKTFEAFLNRSCSSREDASVPPDQAMPLGTVGALITPLGLPEPPCQLFSHEQKQEGQFSLTALRLSQICGKQACFIP